MLRKNGAFFASFDQKSKLSLWVLRVPFDIVNRVIILLASYATCVAVLRTSFCFSQNARRAICTRSLTSKLADSLRLIIVLNRLEALGFVFFEDVNTRFRGDFSITMTEVLGNCREAQGRMKCSLCELEMTAKPSWNDMLRISWNKMNPYAPQCISFALANFKTDRSFQESAKRIHFVVLKR